MKKQTVFGFALAFLCVTFSCLSARSENAPLKLASYQKRPKLIVTLVIDQFRADYLTRFASRFLPATKGADVGGFQYLMSNGAYFPAAHYDILQSMTCAGHAMILSGSYPYASGIVLNEWYDPKLDHLHYCVEDSESTIVGDAGSEKSDGVVGVSPKDFVGSTVGDELKNTGYPSRVVAVALKDRAAILLGGHRADLAFWLAPSHQWVSSKFYLRDGKLPAWLAKLNLGLEKTKGPDYVWKSDETETGFSIKEDAKFSRTLKIGTKKSEGTPLAVELTTDAALAAVDAYKLGSGKTTDILAVSYSSHDILGHDVGPNARAMEEMTISEDRSFARLLNGLRKRIPGGLKDVVITLTGDHGIAPAPSYLKDTGIDGGVIDQTKLMEKGEAAVVDAFGTSTKGKWISAVKSFNFYINREVISAKKASLSDVEQVLKKVILAEPGVAFAFTRSEYEADHLPPGFFAREIRKSYVPTKSGDVVMIQKPFFIEKGPFATHMTGYAYDRNVPLIIAGPHVKAGVYSKDVDVVDLAPTLSFLLGITAPAQSEGRILSEAIGD